MYYHVKYMYFKYFLRLKKILNGLQNIKLCFFKLIKCCFFEKSTKKNMVTNKRNN